ncbi:HLA class II histocompatibility antigen gamma chain [Varanus komodoensis]|uniref:HLA class II histocompatibility antigen gamma chain n=1 Tax=Varanus komodoensis TaxID=61221 RepID=UPI001CF7B04F|nr:HLA class II histocompatibility antigen gamma chain [Varanus komodoensis]
MRYRYSCGRGSTYSAFSILAALLIAGQAVTVYFVYQHNGQISKLTKNTQELQLDSLANKLPHKSKAGNQMKMGMVNMMPLALRDPESLQEEAKLTNSTEDQVKRVLLRGNPSRKFPELKQDFLDNMNQLRRHLGYEDWNAFENWMHKWLLFQLAQTETPKGKVKCNCREEECVEGVHPGKFCARCDENGDYLPEQCHGGTGYCWCVYKNGTMIKGTKVRGNPHCTGKQKTPDAENVTSSGVELM